MISDFTSLALVPTSAIIIKSLNIDSCQCTADIFGECSLNRAAAAAAVGGEVDRGLQQRQCEAVSEFESTAEIEPWWHHTAASTSSLRTGGDPRARRKRGCDTDMSCVHTPSHPPHIRTLESIGAFSRSIQADV